MAIQSCEGTSSITTASIPGIKTRIVLRRLLRGGLLIAVLASLSACSGLEGSTNATEPLNTPVPTSTPSPTYTSTPAGTATPSPTPTPQCLTPEGSVEDASYTGAVLGESINVRLFLPPCYEISETSYPALYLLHGWPYDETHWDLLGAVETAAEKMADGSWPPFILVMPYAPTLLFTGTDGGSWSYEGEFVDGLVPWVDASYRTTPAPTARGFAGISRGGIWSLEVSLLHPDVIDSVAALSPAFAYNQGREAYDPFRLLYRGEPRPQHILLTAGETDWAREETIRFSQQLDRFAIEHELLISSGSHGDETWMQIMEEVLGFFAGVWQVEGQPSP